jgi:hypothetical protein
MYTVYDSKSETYTNPFYFRNKGECIRSFTETVNDSQSTFSKYPADFTLFEIGDFDEFSGVLQPYTAKTSICTALELKRE